MKRKISVVGASLVLSLAGGQAMAADQPETGSITEVPAGHYTLDPLHSKITWGVDHYGFSHYEGQFVDLSGSLQLAEKPSKSQVSVQLPLAEVLTGSALSEHLQGEKFFNSAQYPKASFKSTSIEMTGDDSAKITGELTLNGQTHPLTIDATFNQAAVYPFDKQYRLGFDGTATLKRSDYGIDYLMPEKGQKGISDEVRLDIEAEFVPQSK
ncbi:YceI family protein [Kushneria phosphatilytica]|nr:YceI family protein [Kushneria phosphatilytica]OHV10540.1 hypothetical protein BH688_09095 [Kushneria phosphatilytica]